MPDGAPAHDSKMVTKFPNIHNIDVLDSQVIYQTFIQVKMPVIA